jgi:hypothetical protein
MPARASASFLGKREVDARHISAFTRVFDALWPGMMKKVES